jgi:hypothetical protein
VQWLRAYLTAIAKRNGGSKPWVEVDLNRCFNAKGYALSTGRELFRRLQRDAFWRNLCKVRYVQKRLETNGCFVILVAFRPYLRWDEEPLFYAADRKTSRHVRRALRGEDLELENVNNSVDNRGTARGESRHCPVQQYNNFPNSSTAVPNNIRTAVETPIEALRARKEAPPHPNLPDSTTSVPSTNGSTLRLSLNSRSACAAQQPPEVKPNQGRSTGSRGTDSKGFASSGTTANSVPAKTATLVRVSPSLQRFILWLVFELRLLMQWTQRVPFNFGTVYSFVRSQVIDGHASLAVRKVWTDAVEQTHGDIVEGRVCRKPIALCVARAARLLRQRDRRTREQRMKEFYANHPPKTIQPAQVEE